VTVVFCDLRGFTAFAELSEPEEVMAVLREYHAAAGALILEYEGTLERFTGDGMMVFFNDPVPMPDAPLRAVRMAVAIRDRIAGLSRGWAARGFDLHHGIGIAQGYATLGAIGFEGRWDYGAIGTVTNMAARLCAEAGSDEVLVSHRVAASVGDAAEFGEMRSLNLRGFHRPVAACRVVATKPARA
jgi:class 3 adenylate cyclase